MKKDRMPLPIGAGPPFSPGIYAAAESSGSGFSIEQDDCSCYGRLKRFFSGRAKDFHALAHEAIPVEPDFFRDSSSFGVPDPADFSCTGQECGRGRRCRDCVGPARRCRGEALRWRALIRLPGVARIFPCLREKSCVRPPLRFRHGGWLPERIWRIRIPVLDGNGSRRFWRTWIRSAGDAVHSDDSVFCLAHDERASLRMAARPSGGLM